MQKTVMAMVVAAVIGVSVAEAAPLGRTKAWLEAMPGGVVTNLSRQGITNAANQVAVAQSWEEDTLLQAALRNRAYWLLIQAMTLDKFSEASRAQIKALVRSGAIPPEVGTHMAIRLPAAERAELRTWAEGVLAARYADRPELARLYMQYTFMEGKPVIAPETSENDLVGLLLAPEPLSLVEAEALKQALKARAIKLARLALRAQGKSFVMKDGVNPLAALVVPVVDALNAPGCEGLEAAFRALGCATLQDHERDELKQLAKGWEAQIMQGELASGAVTKYLGTVAIVRGVSAFNRFVAEYNDGKAAVP